MRIALIRKKYTPHGGAERYLQQLVDGLLKAGHEVHLFASKWEEQPGIVFHRVPFVKGLSFLQVISFAASVRKALAKEKFDLVHSLERTVCQDVYRAGDGCHKEWLIQREKIYPWWKNIFTAINPLHRSILYLEKRLYSYPDTKFIIANSQRGKREIISHYAYPADKIEVIYNGVDTKKFHSSLREQHLKPVREKLGLKENDFVLLWVGSGFKRKGLGTLLKSLELLWNEGRRNWHLLIVGKGKIKQYQETLKAKEYKERIIFLGPKSDVLPFYGAADVFVLSTVYEPFANVCLEALACGLPVITTSMNGAGEILTSDTGSVVSDPNDAKELAGAIKHWQDNPQNTGEACRKLAERFPIEQNVQKTLEIYERLSGMQN